MNGFRKDRSAIDGALELISDVEQEKRGRGLVGAVFLDIKGAYGNVVHYGILDTLEELGIGGRLNNWIVSDLSGRTAYMSTSDGDTSQYDVHPGVSQGGVLCSTLFSIKLLGLAPELPCTVKVCAYADDMCIWASGATRPELRARLQRAVTITAKYLRRQGL